MRKSYLILLSLVFVAIVSLTTAYLYRGGPENNLETTTAPLVILNAGLTHQEIAERIGAAMGWDQTTRDQFTAAFRSIQWDAFNEHFASFIGNKLNWSDAEGEIFLTRTTLLLKSSGILHNLYTPGTYEFSPNDSVAVTAEILVNRVLNENSDIDQFFDTKITDSTLEYIRAFITDEVEMKPDLIPLPAQDIGIRTDGKRALLVFSTTYYNIGEGNLEIIADPKTTGIYDDIERTVFQRIYRTDGAFRDRQAGTFLWHQEHLHYHFSDFAEYSLESAMDTPSINQNRLRKKSTFCIRDVSKIDIGIPTNAEGNYLVCGKEKQGVSVGWGDTYFHTYPEQNLDITDIESGTYKLVITVNPKNRFEEITKENNISSVTIEIDKENLAIKIIRTIPKKLPEFEHIHVEQIFAT